MKQVVTREAESKDNKVTRDFSETVQEEEMLFVVRLTALCLDIPML